MPHEEGQAAAGSFGISQAAALVGWSVGRVRRLVREGVLAATRGPRGALRLSFRDLALLRRLRDLGGERILREGARMWSAESGQYLFDFSPACERNVVDFAPRASAPDPLATLDADAWVERGCELDATDRDAAREAYRAALALDPAHVEAHVNLGCLEHEAQNLEDAEAHYRAALSAHPEHAIARFDLAVVLEDLGRERDARAAYEAVLAADPACAEAHHNLARLCDRIGDRTEALRHFVAYRQLAREDD
ncbi:MAG TPA: tetratricopeptide repeat protein [Myxococcota bacterium]|nr:tetratricopeptide repeat protein [Myxococcota bacterium]